MKAQHSKRTARVSSKKVTITTTAKGLTSQAGLLPVAKFLRHNGAVTLTRDTITHARGATARYDCVDALLLTIIATIGGARSICGVVTVWADSVLRKIAGWSAIPDPSTMGRIFKTFGYRQVSELELLNHRLRGRFWKKALRSGTSTIAMRARRVVDVDSTVKPVYGTQQGAAKGYNPGHHGKASYHPLLAFCAETKEILQGWLRSGDAYTSNGVVEFTRQLLAHLPHSQTILFRGDSGFFTGALFDLLEQYGHGYLVKVKLKGLTNLLYAQTWEPVVGKPGWEQCSFWHRCGTWQVSRRFVALRRERMEMRPSPCRRLFACTEYDFFCYVTTEAISCWQAHTHYGKRATCETWIEEAKNQMSLGQMKMDDFWGSSALFQCAVIAYNTVRWMALCSGDTELRRWEPATIRAMLVRVAGKLQTGSRQLKLSTPAHHLYPDQWDSWVAVGVH